MDLITGIKERRSIRKFQDRKVPRQLIEEIVNVAAYAPSWKNTQIARYIVVDKHAANTACTTHNAGAINRNVNSIGSVTPQKIAVKVIGINRPIIFFLFSGFAVA